MADGPSHGGANEAVIKMLNEIQDITNIKKYIDKYKRKYKRRYLLKSSLNIKTNTKISFTLNNVRHVASFAFVYIYEEDA